jgi:hypothetical protein
MPLFMSFKAQPGDFAVNNAANELLPGWGFGCAAIHSHRSFRLGHASGGNIGRLSYPPALIHPN